jgi:hypothetical protein
MLFGLQLLKPNAKVDIFNLASKLPCVVGEICSVPRIAFHWNIIALAHHTIVLTNVNKRVYKITISEPKCFKGE